MDFKELSALASCGRCHHLTALDDCSRCAVGLQALADERTAAVQPRLTRLFSR